MKKFTKFLSVIFAIVICSLSFSVASFATESDFSFEILPDETAALVKCSSSVEGAVTIPSAIPVGGKYYPVKYIGDYAFEGCTAVTSIRISEGIEEIGAYAFKDCTALTDVYMPESILNCAINAFEGCSYMVLHCYSSSYSSIFVYAVTPNLSIDIIDNNEGDIFGTGSETNLMNGIIDLIKRILMSIFRLLFPTAA